VGCALYITITTERNRMTSLVDAYPLSWPQGRKRLNNWSRENARFDVTFARARDEIVRQVGMLAGKHPDPQLIISTNIALRRDGLPLAGQRAPDDPAVAVYFTHKKRQMCFACDRWTKVEHNMQAIAKTIDALRGIARWGTGDMLEAAFTGFAALPAPAGNSWRDVLQVGADATLRVAELNYRRLRSDKHPDRPSGSSAAFDAVQKAWEQAQLELRP
jgi:hypothetical protein